MPTGRYRVMDGDGAPVGAEEFRCAPGPAGWRYFATIDTALPRPHREVVDLVVDSAWRPVQVRIDTGSHRLVLRAEGGRLVGERDGEPLELGWGPDMELDYLSPSFNAVTANRLTGSADIDVVYLEPVTCEPRPERQRYEALGREVVETPVGRFSAARFRYTALPTGWSGDLWVAGDVVVAYDGLFELTEYEPGGSGPVPLD